MAIIEVVLIVVVIIVILILIAQVTVLGGNTTIATMVFMQAIKAIAIIMITTMHVLWQSKERVANA